MAKRKRRRVFKAKYAGRCVTCDQPIEVLQWVKKEKGIVLHVDCFASQRLVEMGENKTSPAGVSYLNGARSWKFANAIKKTRAHQKKLTAIYQRAERARVEQLKIATSSQPVRLVKRASA